ncbi:MAG: PDZ domain-containing protein [Gammaproteobacteria bacterium]|nr:PDZ domain-containing protein [Gammaproteobacteria bacterium]
MFSSMFLTRDISIPKANHIGAQYSIVDSKYVVREVLDGYPSALAGIRRGDILLKANGKPFHPYKSFNPVGKNLVVTDLGEARDIHPVMQRSIDFAANIRDSILRSIVQPDCFPIMLFDGSWILMRKILD